MAATIEQLAHRMVPGARIGDRAAADRTLRRHNVLGLFRDVEAARRAIARVEDAAGDGVHVQFVGFDVSTRDDRRATVRADRGVGEVDPEGVTTMAGRRIVPGLLAGAVLGALVVGGIAGIVTGDAAAALAGALGGAVLFGAVGMLVANFSAFGGSDAWRQTFQPAAPEISLVAVLTDDPAVVEPAAEALRANGAESVEVRDGAGQPVH